jgi:flagellar biosynthetic protein FliR
MHIHLPALSGLVLVYMLVFARTGSMIMVLPGLSEMGVPSRVRLILALAVSVALTPTVSSAYPVTAPASTLALGLLVIQEVIAGLLVGTMARIIMSALHVAGNLIAVQTGLAMAQTLDPSQNSQSAIVSTFFSMLGVVLIFAANLHHLAIGAIAGSYHLIPPGTALPTGDMAELTIRIVSGSFALGFQLAAPFLVFGFALYAGLGVLARLMPQIQIFFVAMPINIVAGFLLLALLLGSMMTMFLDFYSGQMGNFL